MILSSVLPVSHTVIEREMRETQHIFVSRIFPRHIDAIWYNSRFVRKIISNDAIGICPERTLGITARDFWLRLSPVSGKAMSDTGANDHDLSVEGMRDYLSPSLTGCGRGVH